MGAPLREGFTARASDFGVRAPFRAFPPSFHPCIDSCPFARAHFPHFRPPHFFTPQADVVLFDLLLPCDKFTTADVMREVSLFDTIDTAGRYTVKVRTLCQYHRGRCVARAQMRKKRSFGAHLTPMRPLVTLCVCRCADQCCG
jgi:hypothetical protein